MSLAVPVIGAALILPASLTLHDARTRVAHYEQRHGAQVQVLNCRWVDRGRRDAGCLVDSHGVSWMVSVTPHGVINGPAPREYPPVIPVGGY